MTKSNQIAERGEPRKAAPRGEQEWTVDATAGHQATKAKRKGGEEGHD